MTFRQTINDRMNKYKMKIPQKNMIIEQKGVAPIGWTDYVHYV